MIAHQLERNNSAVAHMISVLGPTYIPLLLWHYLVSHKVLNVQVKDNQSFDFQFVGLHATPHTHPKRYNLRSANLHKWSLVLVSWQTSEEPCHAATRIHKSSFTDCLARRPITYFLWPKQFEWCTSKCFLKGFGVQCIQWPWMILCGFLFHGF